MVRGFSFRLIERGGDMGSRKGYKGESCRDVMREIIDQGEIISCSDFYERIKTRGEWRDDTIWQHLMAMTVNLVPAIHRWPQCKPFLFLRPDGRYELHDPGRHPRVVE